MKLHGSESRCNPGDRAAAMTTILYPERLYENDWVEREVYGRKATIRIAGVAAMADLSDADRAQADGLCVHGLRVTGADIARFAKLQVIVHMGVGCDGVDQLAAAARGITVCNVPDYGTTEVADHAMALVLALRRGLMLHSDLQREPNAGWNAITTPLIRRSSVQNFGIIGLGRIGTAVALRAKAFGFNVIFFDPHRPNGSELALGITRAKTLQALLLKADVLSIHTPSTPETRNMLGLAELSVLPYGAVVVNTACGTLLDLDALGALLKEGHIAGAGLDVLAVEPPSEPLPELLRAYRSREAWLAGRLIVTPHSAFHTPEAWEDIRRKSAETMAAALIHRRPQNIITLELP